MKIAASLPTAMMLPWMMCRAKFIPEIYLEETDMLPKNIQLEGTSILVTGAAGFIGSNLVKRLFKEMKSGCVVGLDNMNHYYDVSLKEYRVREIEGQERK